MPVSVSAGTGDGEAAVSLVGLGDDAVGVIAAGRSAGDHESATAARAVCNCAAAPTAVIRYRALR